jgi:hypothetical protein
MIEGSSGPGAEVRSTSRSLREVERSRGCGAEAPAKSTRREMRRRGKGERCEKGNAKWEWKVLPVELAFTVTEE